VDFKYFWVAQLFVARSYEVTRFWQALRGKDLLFYLLSPSWTFYFDHGKATHIIWERWYLGCRILESAGAVQAYCQLPCRWFTFQSLLICDFI
jgi:hypothetical protein